MTSRRSFLHLLGAGLVAPFALQACSRSVPSPAGRPAEEAARVIRGLGGVLGLQLYSLRHYLEKDLPGTLARVRDWGFTEVETAGFYGRTAEEFGAELKRAGLTATSMHAGYDQLREYLSMAVADARAIGARYVTTAWIPHTRPFSREDTDRAAEDFTGWGRVLEAEGFRFTYHLHGYEFAESPEGTLLDTLIRATPADLVDYQMDVFWVVHGGGDPVEYLRRYPGRFTSMHLKDMAEGTTGDLTGQAPDDTNVPLGQGIIDWPSVLRAASESGVKLYYIEDEHDNVVEQIPHSLAYLGGLTI